MMQGQAAGRQQAFAEAGAQEDLDTRKLNREAAQQRKKMGDIELARMQKFGPMQDDVLQQQLQVTQAQLEQQGTQMFQQNTYQAFDKYLEDFNVRHLNSFIQQAKKNPYAPQAFKDVVRIDKVSPASPHMKQLLHNSGLTEQDLDAADGKADGQIDWDVLEQRFVLVTKPDGPQEIADIMQLGIMTGWSEHADDKKLDRLVKWAQVTKTGSTPSAVTTAREVGEARLRLQQGKGKPGDQELVDQHERGLTGGDTSTTKDANRLAEAQTRIANGEGTPEDYAFVDITSFRTGGVNQAQHIKAERARDEYDAKFPADTPWEKLRANREAESLIRQIEISAGLDLQDRKILREASRSIQALSRSVDLSGESVGPIDAHFARLSKYVSNLRGGREAGAAYNAQVNEMLTNLFGATVPDGEQRRFNEAYGTNTQQIGWLLEGLKSMGEMYRSDMEHLLAVNDPRVVKYRSGHNYDDLENALNGIEARITYYDERAKGRSHAQAAEAAMNAVPTVAWEGIDPKGQLVGRERPVERQMETPSRVTPTGGAQDPSTLTPAGASAKPPLNDLLFGGL
jgi:hypothetical protein